MVCGNRARGASAGCLSENDVGFRHTSSPYAIQVGPCRMLHWTHLSEFSLCRELHDRGISCCSSLSNVIGCLPVSSNIVGTVMASSALWIVLLYAVDRNRNAYADATLFSAVCKHAGLDRVPDAQGGGGLPQALGPPLHPEKRRGLC